MGAFQDSLTVTASTKRNSTGTGMVEHLTGVAILPLMPVGEEVLETVMLESPRKGRETYCADADIEEGDQLIVAGTAYIVRYAGAWPWDATDGFIHLVVEEVM